MKYLSLFSGIGGFELGIYNAEVDWKCIGFSDIDKDAIKVYKAHFPQHINYGDITKIKTEDLEDFDILVGGPPCQPYSIAGHRKGLDDKRGGPIFNAIFHIVEKKQPKVILLENVRGLVSHNNGDTLKKITDDYKSIGYNIKYDVLNSENFGVPQKRERIFILIYKDNLLDKFKFPNFNVKSNLYELKSLSLEEAKKIQEKNGVYTQNKKDLNTNKVRFRYRVPPTYTFQENIDKTITPIFKFLEVNPPESVYLNSNEVPKMKGFGADYSHGGYLSTKEIYSTITSSYGRITGNSMKIIRNGKLSILSPIECERLQGFPDNWTAILDNHKMRYKCIGNAVTTNVITELIKEIQKCLNFS